MLFRSHTHIHTHAHTHTHTHIRTHTYTHTHTHTHTRTCTHTRTHTHAHTHKHTHTHTHTHTQTHTHTHTHTRTHTHTHTHAHTHIPHAICTPFPAAPTLTSSSSNFERSSTGSLLPPILVSGNGSPVNGVTSPLQHQTRSSHPKLGSSSGGCGVS